MNQVVEKIAQEIRKQGAIPFARFMEVALYCPVYGYYEKEEDTVGRRGDFYTSVSVGSLFGELLACQFSEWLGEGQGGNARAGLGPQSSVAQPECGNFQIVEAGAHRGELARDILSWLRHQRPRCFQRIEYWIVEPSGRRRTWQQERLAEFGDRVRWAADLSEVGQVVSGSDGPKPPARRIQISDPAGVHGVIFSNELLDALPVHRFGWDAAHRSWFEWGVTLREDQFVWTRLVPMSGTAEEVLSQFAPANYSTAALEDLLPDGYSIEVSPATVKWWRQAAGLLRRGILLAIDYGFSGEEFLRPEREGGTLRAYYRHQLSPDVLARAGAQDLTAHVNFGQLRRIGEATGLKTEALATQEQFLTRIGARIWNGITSFGEWTPARTRQFQTLTHPEHLGRAFRVLVQSRVPGCSKSEKTT